MQSRGCLESFEVGSMIVDADRRLVHKVIPQPSVRNWLEALLWRVVEKRYTAQLVLFAVNDLCTGSENVRPIESR